MSLARIISGSTHEFSYTDDAIEIVSSTGVKLRVKLGFFEVAKINSPEKKHEQLNGKLVVVRAMAQHEIAGEWAYDTSFKDDGAYGVSQLKD